MALFMDSHTIEGGVAASDVAAAHEADQVERLANDIADCVRKAAA